MRIVRLLGGLGNQMWQYAFLIALKENFPDEDVYYDASFFNGYPLHNGFELDRIFNISARQATKKDIRKVYHYFVGKYLYSRIYRHYFPVMKSEIRELESEPYQPQLLVNKGDFYYDGYWADHRYFDKCRVQLLKEFSLKEPLDEKNKKILSEYKDDFLCSMHIRRGDYLKDPDYMGICDKIYYQQAIDKILQKSDKPVVFLVFSNDLAWCKENLSESFKNNKVIYVDWNIGGNSYKDMYLMSKCQANIIANSSFSWWAAYLNEIPNKIVVSPEKYKNKEMGFKVPLDEWICI